LIEGLKHNLLSISQLCNKSFKIIFDDFYCDILDKKTNTRVLSDFHENNVYMINVLNLNCNATCLNAFNEDFWLWRRRLGVTVPDTNNLNQLKHPYESKDYHNHL